MPRFAKGLGTFCSTAHPPGRRRRRRRAAVRSIIAPNLCVLGSSCLFVASSSTSRSPAQRERRKTEHLDASENVFPQLSVRPKLARVCFFLTPVTQDALPATWWRQVKSSPCKTNVQIERCPNGGGGRSTPCGRDASAGSPENRSVLRLRDRKCCATRVS